MLKNRLFKNLGIANVLAVIVMILVYAGCSFGMPSTNSDKIEAPGEDSEEVTITFAADEYQRRLFESLMKTFHEQNPNITIQFVGVSQAYPSDGEWTLHKYYRNLSQAADTILLQGTLDLDMSVYFRDLQPLYESDPSFEPDDFWPGILTACEDTMGNVVGLPLSSSVNGVFYDESAFNSAGIPHPKPGWTWDDFRNAVDALALKNGSQMRYGFYDNPDLFGSILAPIVSNHLRSHGGEVDAAALLDEILWYIKLAQDGKLVSIKVDEDWNKLWEERAKLFADEELHPAMWIDAMFSFEPSGSYSYDSDNPFSGISIEKYGVAPFPISADNSSTFTNRSWVDCASISAGSKHPRAAWTWLNFLSKQRLVFDERQAFELGRAPARQSVADSSGYWEKLPEKVIPSIRFALEHGSYGFNEIDKFNGINLALHKAIYENADFTQEIETALSSLTIQPTPPPDEGPIVVATPLPPVRDGVSEIKYFKSMYSSNEVNVLKKLVEAYNQQSSDAQINLVLDFSVNPEEDWIRGMSNEFDCFTTDIPFWGTFDPSTVLTLNSLLEKEPDSFGSDFNPEMMEGFRKDGNLYALPAARQIQIMAYNADLLARRGLQPPANDWTFEDFLELASAAASTEESDASYGYLYNPNDDFISLGKGIKWADLEANPPIPFFDTQEVLDHLNWLIQMNQENVIFSTGNSENEWNELNTIMTSGQLAFWTAMTGEEGMWLNVTGQEGAYKIGVAPIPRYSEGNTSPLRGFDYGHFISAHSEAQQACWDWIKFLTEQPDLFAGIPARRSIAESPAWEASIGKNQAAAYRAAFENYKPVEGIGIENQLIFWPLTELRRQAVAAGFEGKDPEMVLNTQQQKAEAYLACASVLDDSKPVDQINQDIITCLKQTDPDGNW